MIWPYHVIEYPCWVNVVALSTEGQIILIRQYRHGIGEILTELPCGGANEGEEPEDAIKRELLEETGYGGGWFYPIGRMYANPANQNNRVWSFLAVDVEKEGSPRSDDGEDLEVVFRDFVSVLGEVGRGEFILQGLHIAALHLAVQYILSRRVPRLMDYRDDLLCIVVQ